MQEILQRSVTMHEHIRWLLARERRAVDETNAEAEAAWGPTAIGKALPQALQLADRIEVGKMLQAERPRDASIRQALAQLQSIRQRALRDPADQRRCAAFEQAHERFLAAERLYLARIQEAQEIYHLSDEEITDAQHAERVSAPS